MNGITGNGGSIRRLEHGFLDAEAIMTESPSAGGRCGSQSRDARMGRRLFLSYAHIEADRKVAHRLYRDLADNGLSPWIDDIDLQPGDDWRLRIGEEIRACKYFLAILSSASLTKKGFVQNELKQALEVLDSMPIDERFLIPIRLNECRPTDVRIARLHWLDLFPMYECGLERLLRTLRDSERIHGRLYVDVGVEIPADIGAWDDARLFPYISSILVPEARILAQRDYEGWALRDEQAALGVRIDEKLEQAAVLHGFVEGWQRYRGARRRDEAPQQGADRSSTHGPESTGS